jgi:hypothetical protein
MNWQNHSDGKLSFASRADTHRLKHHSTSAEGRCVSTDMPDKAGGQRRIVRVQGLASC